MLGTIAGGLLLSIAGYNLIAWSGSSGFESVPMAEFAAPAVPPPAPPPVPGPAQPQPPAPLPPVSLDGIILKGVMGGGPEGGAAIIALAGVERPVRVGRDVQPGLRLKSIGVSHALLSTSSGEMRIDLNRAGATSLAAASPSPSRPAAVSTAAAAERRETIEFRLGLQPMRSNGRVAGFALRPDARIPRFQRAGLTPGDVIVAVNGSAFDEERLMELSWGLANSTATELEFIRGGRRMKVQL